MIFFPAPTFRGLSTLRGISTWKKPRYKYLARLLNIEKVDYRFGVHHPISIGDSFAQDRYRILHNIKCGSKSTVWLAREQGEAKPGRLVTIKALCTYDSTTNNPELTTHIFIQTTQPPVSGIRALHDHFFVEGPNGCHLFLVYPFVGPSMVSMFNKLYRIDPEKRLRAKLARKLIRKLVTAVDSLHRAGIVHGDITPENILFNLVPHVVDWTGSDELVYVILGDPIPEKFNIEYGELDNTLANFAEDSVILADFGKSYVNSQPENYEPIATSKYLAPETRFEGRASFEADVWMLGCTIFEIYTRKCLFCHVLWSDEDRLEQIKEWVSWFTVERDATGVQHQVNMLSELRERLAELPVRDTDEVPPPAEELYLFADLLVKMLMYRPQDRIRLREVLEHPWLSNN